MANNNISYPHPVLGNGDDVAGEDVSLELEYEISDESIRIVIANLSAGHADIDNLISTGDAAWHIRVQCPRTYMREQFISNEAKFNEQLNGKNYEGSVDVSVSIVTQNKISQYNPTGLHSDYDDSRFDLDAGTVIAIFPAFKFHVDKIYDPLKAPVSSLVRITKGAHRTGAYTLTLEEDSIVICLSESDWSEYAGIRDRVPTVVHSAIVLPALAEAIRCLDDYSFTRWGGRLSELLSANDINASSPFAAAQEILSNPIARTFKEVNATLDRGET